MFAMAVIGSLTMGAAVAIRWLLRRRHARLDLDGPLGAEAVEPGVNVVPDVAVLATESGIADVDPEPLAQVAGEGIDADRVEEAHRELPELHERLPHS